MSKTPQLALSKLGYAFLAVLKDRLQTTVATDSQAARSELNALGFDDQCLLTIKELYEKRGVVDILNWLQSEGMSSSALFVVINAVRRSSEHPLTGLLSYVLQETIVLHPLNEDAKEESVTEICVPSFNVGSVEEAYFDNLSPEDYGFSEDQGEYLQDLLIGRFKEAINQKLKNEACPRGQARTFLIDCQGHITGNAEYDTFLKEQIHVALQEVVSELNVFQVPKMAGFYFLTDVSLSDVDENLDIYKSVVSEAEYEYVYREIFDAIKPTTIMLTAGLSSPEEGASFVLSLDDEEAVKAVVSDPRFSQTLATTQHYFAEQYLEAFGRTREAMQDESSSPSPYVNLANRSPTQSMQNRALAKSIQFGLQAYFKKKKAVLLSVSIVPIVLGAVLGLSLGASGVISTSVIPSAFISFGPMIFGVVAGIVGGIGLTLVMLMVAGPLLKRQENKFKLPLNKYVTNGDLTNPFMNSRAAPDEPESKRDKLSELIEM